MAKSIERPAEALARRAVEAILRRIHALPRLDDRSEDAILGYDEHGIPR